MFKKGDTLNLNINLSSKEKNIFDFLKSVKSYFKLNVEMRIAGGWVRDKIMGRDSDDIDIALSNITGTEFVNYIKKYPDAKKYIGKDYQVAANAEKSKHLETAGIDILNQKIEFVNLRSEEYGNSRIPTVKETTPEIDAQRRDLTINALFYNIETGKVEDYVGGVSDLQNGILKTPQNATQTFKDDPLRMLRALRFLSRYKGFTLDSEAIKAMQDPSVQEAFKNKVSLERSGPEIMKMMVGKNLVPSLKILFDTNLYKSVFPGLDDIHEEGIHMEQQTPYHKYNLLNHTLETISNLDQIMVQNGENDEMRGLMNLAALFHDFGKMKKGLSTPHPKNPNQMQYLNHEKESELMADNILKSIGIGKDERDIVRQVISLHMAPHQSEQWGNKGKANFLRKSRMRGKEEEHKDLWKYIFYHAEADDMASQPDNFDKNKRQDLFNNFKNYVEKPPTPRKLLINGNDIKNIIPEIKPGEWIAQLMQEIQQLQDEGSIQTREQAIDFVQNKKQEILKMKNASKNWYKRIKIAQVKDEDGITYGPNPAKSKYREGMKVVERRGKSGVYGRIKKIEGSKMTIKWFDKSGKYLKETVADINEDTVGLSVLIQVAR